VTKGFIANDALHYDSRRLHVMTGPKRLSRVVIAATALAIAATAVLRHRFELTKQADLVALLRASALPVDEQLARREIGREPDTVRSELLIAGLLVDAQLDAQRFTDLPPDRLAVVVRQGESQLALARRLSAGALAARPASARAAMALGASTYLGWARARDVRLFTAARRWEAPLVAATELQPASRQAQQLLLGAYLELWPSLSAAKRETARALVRDAFEDAPTFQRLIAHWLAIVADADELFASLPERPFAWARLMAMYAEAREWPLYVRARERWHVATRANVERWLANADARRAGGDARKARDLYLSTVTLAPPDGRYADVALAALQRCPPGPPVPGVAPAFRAWLEWALDLVVVGRPPFPATALARLTAGAGELPPGDRALALLAAGDLAAAERLERRTGECGSEAWSPFALARATALMARGDAAGAQASLDCVVGPWRHSAAYDVARTALARVAGVPSAAAPAARVGGVGPATGWRFRHGAWQIEVEARGRLQAVEIEIVAPAERGGAVEVSWDGTRQAIHVATEPRRLRVDVAAAPGLHLLQLVPVDSRAPAPGVVRLLE
jgi:hypothetical protein